MGRPQTQGCRQPQLQLKGFEATLALLAVRPGATYLSAGTAEAALSDAGGFLREGEGHYLPLYGGLWAELLRHAAA